MVRLLHRARRLVRRTDFLLAMVGLSLWGMVSCWAWAQHDGIINVIERLFVGGINTIQVIKVDTFWNAVFSIGYWLLFLFLLFFRSYDYVEYN